MRLTVIVTVVDGGEALRRCLRALESQQGAPELEVLVPLDDTAVAAARIVAEFPGARLVPLGRVPTAAPPAGHAGQHELYDRRRSAGLGAATGDLVAMLEDRGVPRPDWAAAAVRAHARHPHLVVGGAIENGRDAVLNWAVYVCDFGRYQLPLPSGPAAYVADVNVCYKREAVELTREIWRDRFHETTVHWALRRAGHDLYLDPSLVVDQHRDGLSLGPLLRERFAWGRLFAHTRVRECGAAARIVLALLSPLLPILLFARHAAAQARRRRTLGRFLTASPAVAVLLVAWAAGEMAGYVTGRP